MYIWWFYMFLTFFEPNNSKHTDIQRNSSQFLWVWVIEAIILTYFWIDMIIKIQYMYIAGRRIGFKRVFIDDFFIIHITCVGMMILDAILFYSIYPSAHFRFGRIFRAIKAVLESREVFRTTKAILYWLPQIIDLGWLLMLVSFLYAVFGNRFLDHNTPGISVSNKIIISIAWKWIWKFTQRNNKYLLSCNSFELPCCIASLHKS